MYQRHLISINVQKMILEYIPCSTIKINLNVYYGISKGIQTSITDSQTFLFSLKSIEMIYGSTSSLLDMNSAK